MLHSWLILCKQLIGEFQNREYLDLIIAEFPKKAVAVFEINE